MINPGCRGQSGLEMIVGIAFIIVVFYVVVLIAMDKTQEASDIKTLLDVSRVGGSVRDNLNMISQQGPGYYSYFSLPEQIQGGYDYNVSISGNVLELMWAEKAWSANLLASNVTVHCLSFGPTVKNRVLYGGGGLEVACHLPNLKVAPGSIELGDNFTTFRLWNDAHVDASWFLTVFETNNTRINATLPGLAPGEQTQLRFNATPQKFINISIDYRDEVNETIEWDNNVTLEL